MSKNGKLLFKDFNPYITSPFGNRIHPITKVMKMHDGVDYGTFEKKIPVYAIEEGRVIRTGYTSQNGNFVYVEFNRLGKNAIYQHLDSIKVKGGDIVNSNTIIGITGKTGAATGIHLHFGWFPSSDQNKDWYSKRWEDFESYDYPEIIKYLGNPVKRDTSKKQIEVLVHELRVRNSPNGEILGYINLGIYDVLDVLEKDNYTWYKIADDNWIAYNEAWEVLYEKEVEQDDDKKEEKDEQEKIDKECKKKIWYKIIDFILDVFKKVLSIFKIK